MLIPFNKTTKKATKIIKKTTNQVETPPARTWLSRSCHLSLIDILLHKYSTFNLHQKVPEDLNRMKGRDGGMSENLGELSSKVLSIFKQ
jgi:hypothetical protein